VSWQELQKIPMRIIMADLEMLQIEKDTYTWMQQDDKIN
jgi:hypothetical protein